MLISALLIGLVVGWFRFGLCLVNCLLGCMLVALCCWIAVTSCLFGVICDRCGVTSFGVILSGLTVWFGLLWFDCGWA